MEIERIKVILWDLPAHIKGMTTRSYDNGEEFYTIWLNANLDHESLCRAYDHEMKHIEAQDMDGCENIQYLEVMRHA